jgi:hypothetical protein
MLVSSRSGTSREGRRAGAVIADNIEWGGGGGDGAAVAQNFGARLFFLKILSENFVFFVKKMFEKNAAGQIIFSENIAVLRARGTLTFCYCCFSC